MVAVSTLSAGWKAFFFAVSLALFLLGRFGRSERLRLESLGLAFFVFPFVWDNLAAS